MKRYNKEYDAYYDDEKDIWLESKCGSKTCGFCKDRPEKPSQCEVP